MEKHTFTASTYIGVDAYAAYRYLADLKNLGEWTLNSKMREQVDADTWIGTSSVSAQPLYYHLHRLPDLPFPAFEWHCGTELHRYQHIHPIFLFPSEYVEPGTTERGVYFHWLSFGNPAKRTQAIEEGILDLVHNSESRLLKARLERANGLRSSAKGRFAIKAKSIFVDAPFDLLAEYLGDPVHMNDWGHLFRLERRMSSNNAVFMDEYDHPLEVRTAMHRFSDSVLIEYDALYPGTGRHVRTPVVIVPCAHAFGEPSARGCILHRLYFAPSEDAHIDNYPDDDIAAENLNIKRIVEAKAGNAASLAKGFSYTMPEAGSAGSFGVADADAGADRQSTEETQEIHE